MGQGLSCRGNNDHGLFIAVQQGNLQIVTTLLQQDPSLFHQKTLFDRFSPLHIAAANGQIEVNSFSLFSGISAKFSLRINILFCFVCNISVLFQILSRLLHGSVNPDVLNRKKQVMVGYVPYFALCFLACWFLFLLL